MPRGTNGASRSHRGNHCKSAGNAYGGSNPSSATQREIPGTNRFRGFFAFELRASEVQGPGNPPLPLLFAELTVVRRGL